MVFIYSCVARGPTILTDFTTPESRNASEISLNSSIQECLRQVNSELQTVSSKNSFQVLKKSIMNIDFHVFESHGFLFLVATEVKQADDKDAAICTDRKPI